MKVEEIKLAFETNVQLTLIDDINKGLDAANAKKRQYEAQAIKVAEDLNNLQVDYAKVFQISAKAMNSAKELGATDLEKALGARGQEAKDFGNAVGQASNGIKSAVSKL